MKGVRKAIFVSVAVFCLLCVATLPIFASESELLEGFGEELSDELATVMDGSESFEEYAERVKESSRAEYLLELLMDAISGRLGATLTLFFTLCALLVLCALFGSASASFENDALNTALRYCTSGAIFCSVIYLLYENFLLIEEFFDSLGTLMRAMIPISATVWAMGGNVGSASASSASLYVMLSVSEAVFRQSVAPVCSVMCILGLCDAMSDETRMGKMLSAIKKIYNFVLSALMMLMLSSLSAQTAISASADSLAARSARMVSGSFIPILGGSIAETLRTVSGGVSYLKNIFGIGAIIMIGALTLPVIVSIFLYRAVFLICSGIAQMLGCHNESRLLDNLGEVYGTMLAVTSGVGVMFVLSLCVFVGSVVAVA